MDKVRGILLVALGAFVLYRGLVMRGSPSFWPAIGLGLASISLGLWRLLRKPPQTRV